MNDFCLDMIISKLNRKGASGNRTRFQGESSHLSNVRTFYREFFIIND